MTRWWVFLVCACSPWIGLAQTGVNDDRVSLPEGPGSLEGLGDNAAFGGNQGAMTYTINVDAPEGFEAVTPDFSITYNSMAGNGIAGMGFSLNLPMVERMTSRGLPTYTDADRFVVDGVELVRVSDAEPALYRARFEGEFARYFWHRRDAADGGYWRVERTDGSVDWYGVDADARPVPESRLQGADGPFRWHRVERRDRFDHRLVYRYASVAGRPYLERAEYIFTAVPAPEASVRFFYGDREDLISDARSGFNEQLTQRLTGIEAWSAGVRVRRYALAYEPYASSGGLSRLASVEHFGVDDLPHPARVAFEYSTALGGVCQARCDDPFLVRMGSVGVSPGAGNATFVDLNGDTLPDIIDTAQPGPHRIFLSVLDADGHRFAPMTQSETGRQASHELASPYTQVLDANGDGRADLVNVRTGQVLFNLGDGDWAPVEALGSTDALPDFGEAFAVGAEELTHIRFFDYDNDRRIDVVRSNALTTEVFANRGAAGFEPVDGVEAIGAGFAEQRLEFADLNGDGLLDPVILRAGGLRYRLNLGRGRWSDWRDIEALPFNAAELDFVELEDLNGDSLDDIVLVLADEVRYALNRTGDRFGAPASIRGTAQGALPERVDGTTVLFADMNGSGSDDVVWIGANGAVTYLEIFPLRPNLLTSMQDGLGLVTEVEYTTAAQARAHDDAPWTDGPLFAMAMVAQTVTRDPATGEAEVQRRRYREGYYDPDERQFRGFGRVETITDGDETHAGNRRVVAYDLGQGAPERAGRLLESAVWALDADAPLQRERHTHEACGLTPDHVAAGGHFVCRVAHEIDVLEGAPADEHVTTRTEYTYDLNGNLIHEAQLGVVHRGGGCAPCRADGAGGPCGPACEGDEAYAWTDFIDPSAANHQQTGLAWRQRGSARPDGPYTETLNYYDGPDFEGLSQRQATLGLLTRSMVRVDAETLQPAVRQGHDRHGNVVRGLSAAATDVPGFEARTEYDETGLDIIAEERDVSGPDGLSHVLRRELVWDPAQGHVTHSSNWYVMGAPGPRHWAEYTYDGLGRLLGLALPGDDRETPSRSWIYDFDGPLPRVVQRERSVRNMRLPDRESVQCFDRAGRLLQVRTRVADGVWQVSGFKRYDRRGRVADTFLGHRSPTGACAVSPPAGTPKISNRFDALGRAVRTVEPAPGIPPTVRTRVFRPLRTLTFDGEDSDPDSPAFDTPTIAHQDGLGRAVAMQIDTGDGMAWTRLGYDERGHLHVLVDPAGNRRTQQVDALGRVWQITGPDRGTLTIEHDAAGRQVRTEDATGRVIEQQFDSLGRRLAVWDAADPAASRSTFTYDLPEGCPAERCTQTAEGLVGVRYRAAGVPVEEWYGYDARRQVVQTRFVLDGMPLDVEAEYDNLGDLRIEHYPGDLSLSFERDGGGRLTRIPGVVDALVYSPQSDVESRRFSNGVEEIHDFDALGRTIGRRITAADATPLVDLGYHYNRVGHLTEIVDSAPPRAGPGWGARFEYDPLYRLTRAALDPDRPDWAETLDYAYGQTGRLQAKTSSRGAASPLHVGDIAYDPARPHAAIAAGDMAYAYDAAGRMTERGDVRFVRDVFGRIEQAWRGETLIGRFGYSPTGRRVLRVEGGRRLWSLGDTIEIEDGALLVHARLNEQRLATIETDGIADRVLPDLDADARITTADAVLSADDDAHLRAVLRASARRNTLEGQARQTFYHTDHMRSVLLVTDADGAVLESRSHAPYGAARHADSGVETTASLAGKHTDRSTGLTFFGARYYDSALGRWAAPDPAFTVLDADQLGDPVEAIDPYGFSRGNPVNYTDADGQKAFGAAVAGAVVGVLTAGTANVVAAVAAGAIGFTGAVVKEIIYYRVGKVKVNWRTVLGSAVRITSRTLGATLAAGALGLPWVGVELFKTVARTGLAYGAARSYNNGQATERTTIWDTMTFLIDQISLSASAARFVSTGLQAGGLFVRHALRRPGNRQKVRSRLRRMFRRRPRIANQTRRKAPAAAAGTVFPGASRATFNPTLMISATRPNTRPRPRRRLRLPKFKRPFKKSKAAASP